MGKRVRKQEGVKGVWGTAVDGTSEVVSLRHDVTAERKPPRNAPGKGNGREEMAAAEHWRGTAGRVSVNRRDATVAFGQGRGPRGGRGEAAGASGGQSRCFSETISLVPPQITGQRPLQGRRTAPRSRTQAGGHPGLQTRLPCALDPRLGAGQAGRSRVLPRTRRLAVVSSAAEI